MSAPVLEIDGLEVEFATHAGTIEAVRGVSLSIGAGETLAIVGESGSGKSVTALSIMGLVDKPGRITAGNIRFEGQAIVGLREPEYQRLRGGPIAMVFQDPLSSLNPALRIGDQIAEAVRVHQREVGKPAARTRAVELLDLVGIPQAEVRARDYPHQLSGGMRQRVMIAMAIANEPRLLIADEPTTALDVTIQAQVLEVLRDAQQRTHAALLLITHDLGIVAGITDRVAVMYAGRIVEEGPLDEVFYEPRHPYTVGLLGAIPRLDTDRRAPLSTIPGAPPGRLLPPGCSFAPRCTYAVDACRSEQPLLSTFEQGEHRAACFRAEELPALATAATRDRS